jgi:hypothetical protein
MGGRVYQRQHTAHAVADDGYVGLAAILLHLTYAGGQEVLGVVGQIEALLFRQRRLPVDDVDVEAALQQVLHHALAGSQIEHVGLVGGGHHQQNGHPVDFIGLGQIVIQAQCAALVDHLLGGRAHHGGWRRDVLQTLDAAQNRLVDDLADALRGSGCGALSAAHGRSPALVTIPGHRAVAGFAGDPSSA